MYRFSSLFVHLFVKRPYMRLPSNSVRNQDLTLGMTSHPFAATIAATQPLLRIHAVQSQQDTSVPPPEGHPVYGPGSCHLASRLLQLPSGWCSLPVSLVFCSSSTMQQPGMFFTRVLPHFTATPPHLPTLHWLPEAP